MPEIQNTSFTERTIVYDAMDKIEHSLKEIPTFELIVKNSKYTSRETKRLINKMVREGWLTAYYVGPTEYIEKSAPKKKKTA